MKYEKEYAFLGIVGDVLNGKTVRSLPEGVTADDIFAIGSKQDMAPITFCALNSIKGLEKGTSWMKYQKRFLSDCSRSEMQLGEYDKLIPYLCEQGVKVLPLKGCVIKKLYPAPSLRVMSDIDLLYEGVTPQELAELMDREGYSTESLERVHHDVFYKKPYMNVELHRKLVAEDSSYKSVLQNMFEKAIRDEKIHNLYHMKPEDLYIHVIVHTAKHFEHSGIGIRPIGDIYVLNQTYKNSFDWNYIKDSLASVGLAKFEEKLRTLAYAFFGEEKQEEEVSELDLEFLFKGGTYGDISDPEWINYSVKIPEYKSKGEKSGLRFIFSRVFLPFDDMKERYAVLERKPYLLPFFRVYRFYDIAKNHRSSIKGVIGASGQMNSPKYKYVGDVMDSFGLKR